MRQAPSEELLRPTRPSRRGETAPTLRAGGTVPTSRRIMSHSTLGEDLWSSTRMGTGSFDERSHRRSGRFGLAFAIGRYVRALCQIQHGCVFSRCDVVARATRAISPRRVAALVE